MLTMMTHGLIAVKRIICSMAFRFRQRQVADQRAQENFEQLEGDLVKNWLALAAPLAAGRKIAFGGGTVTWLGGSTFSSLTTVNHGLGVTPTAVVVCDAAGGGLAHNAVFTVNGGGLTNTQFSVNAETGDLTAPANGTTRNFFWAAIG
jgi:hypothetical protein